MHRSNRTIRQLTLLGLFVTATVAFVFVATSSAKAQTTGNGEQTVVNATASHDRDAAPAEVSLFARHHGVASAPLPPAVVSGAFLLASNFVVTRLWKKRKL